MEKISLNTGWQFEKLPGRSIMDIGAGHTVMCDQGRGCYVDLPHTWYQDDDQYRGLTVYKKTIYISKYQGKRVFLDIGGGQGIRSGHLPPESIWAFIRAGIRVCGLQCRRLV